jgi:hypothetical protein
MLADDMAAAIGRPNDHAITEELDRALGSVEARSAPRDRLEQIGNVLVQVAASTADHDRSVRRLIEVVQRQGELITALVEVVGRLDERLAAVVGEPRLLEPETARAV